MKTIAITGSIGSGKSLVGQILAVDFPVIDCDRINRELLTCGQAGYQAVSAVFASCVIDGSLDRKALRELIFSDDQARQRLNAIMHPLILREVRRRIARLKDQEFVFVEVPLLFETGWDRYFDFNVTVIADPQIIETRLRQGRELGTAMLEKIRRTQKSAEERRTLTDYVIENNGSARELEQAVWIFVEKLRENSL